MFNNYNLTDDDVIGILNKYENLINKYSRLYPGGPIDEDLKGEIIEKIYKQKIEKNKKILEFVPFTIIQFVPNR